MTQNAAHMSSSREKCGSNTHSNSEDKTMLHFKIRMQSKQRKMGHNLDFSSKFAGWVHLIHIRLLLSVFFSHNITIVTFSRKLHSSSFSGIDMKVKLNLWANAYQN